MRILALSGWGQPHDVLKDVVPEATHLDYAHHTLPQALEHIAQAAKNHDAVIGWSLGGQLAVRAIASGMMRPKRLVLLGVPFTFDKEQKLTYETFRANYEKNPARTLHKGWELIAYGDTRADTVREHMARHDKQKMLNKNWLAWLDRLMHFDAGTFSLKDFPPTLLVHGDVDAVIHVAHAQRFTEALPQSRLAIWPGCGHAPHWHNPEGLKKLIGEHLV